MQESLITWHFTTFKLDSILHFATYRAFLNFQVYALRDIKWKPEKALVDESWFVFAD